MSKIAVKSFYSPLSEVTRLGRLLGWVTVLELIGPEGSGVIFRTAFILIQKHNKVAELLK